MRVTIFAALLSLIGFAVAASDCAPDRVSLRGNWGREDFTVELADTNETRERGLMFRESMPRFSGMLFVYDAPHHARFWMKNTLIPLDMIFVGPNGVVQKIHKLAVPHDETTIDGGNGIIAILEINGGLADMLGITVGSEMQHPAFGATAVWPCN